jgi:hypothetical protein
VPSRCGWHSTVSTEEDEPIDSCILCDAVASKRKDECQRTPAMEVPAAVSTTAVGDSPVNGGYLASIVTEETGCGSMDTPWVIRAQPGQTIRIHLLDFGMADRAMRADSGHLPYVCQVLEHVCNQDDLCHCMRKCP